jgi:hypothetical protein
LPTIWACTDFPGWRLQFGNPRESRRYLATFAARRRDVAHSPGGGEAGDSSWYITQRFHEYQLPLVVRWVTIYLLEAYANRLATLRDHAASRRRISRPVRLAVELDDYVISDGLDSEAITIELLRATDDIDGFRWHVPEYQEDVIEYGPNYTEAPTDFLPWLGSRIRSRATILKEASHATTGSIQASAALLQAIANTRLQRILLGLAVLALVVSGVGIWIAATSGPR